MLVSLLPPPPPPSPPFFTWKALHTYLLLRFFATLSADVWSELGVLSSVATIISLVILLAPHTASFFAQSFFASGNLIIIIWSLPKLYNIQRSQDINMSW